MQNRRIDYTVCSWCVDEFRKGERNNIAYKADGIWVYHGEMLHDRKLHNVTDGICSYHREEMKSSIG